MTVVWKDLNLTQKEKPISLQQTFKRTADLDFCINSCAGEAQTNVIIVW